MRKFKIAQVYHAEDEINNYWFYYTWISIAYETGERA